MKPKPKIKIDIKSKRKVSVTPQVGAGRKASAYNWGDVIEALKGQTFDSESSMLEGVINAIIKESSQPNTEELQKFLRTALETDDEVMDILRAELIVIK